MVFAVVSQRGGDPKRIQPRETVKFVIEINCYIIVDLLKIEGRPNRNSLGEGGDGSRGVVWGNSRGYHGVARKLSPGRHPNGRFARE